MPLAAPGAVGALRFLLAPGSRPIWPLHVQITSSVTGFFISIPGRLVPSTSFHAFVTARHVAEALKDKDVCFAPPLMPATEYAARAAGGLRLIANCPESELVFRKRDFLEAYRRFRTAPELQVLPITQDARRILAKIASVPEEGDGRSTPSGMVRIVWESKVADPVIIRDCGFKNRVLLTGDQDLVHTYALEIKKAKIAVFVTTNNNEGPAQWGPRIIAAKSDIWRELGRRKKPFTARISTQGRITQVRVYEQGTWKAMTIGRKNPPHTSKQKEQAVSGTTTV